MAEIYGRLWESSYGAIGSATFNAWSRGIASLSPEQIKHGLEAVIDSGEKFPPNLVEFVKMCRSTTVEYHKPAIFLPPPVRKDHGAKDRWKKAAIELGVLKP